MDDLTPEEMRALFANINERTKGFPIQAFDFEKEGRAARYRGASLAASRGETVSKPDAEAERDKSKISATPYVRKDPKTLPPRGSENGSSKGYKIDRENGYLDIYWGGYEYSIELSRIDTPPRFLAMLCHMLSKGGSWQSARPTEIARLIDALNQHFGWDMYRG